MEIENALSNLKEMLLARGETITNSEADQDSSDYSKYYNEIVTLETEQTIIKFCLSKDTLKEFIKEIKDLDVEQIEEQYGTKKLIVIERPSQTSTLILEEKDRQLMSVGGYLQLFDIKYLQYNPAAHVNTPLHQKMTDADVRALLDQYQLKNRFQLPIIHRTDIMARWLGLNHGDVVKITRHNETSGVYMYYRCCM